MVGGALVRASVLSVGLGVGGSVVVSGSHVHPSHSCDGWVCDLGVVVDSSVFGLIRGSGVFATVLPTFVLVSRMQFAQQYRVNDHFIIAVSSSRHEQWSRCPGEVFDCECRLGCQWGYHRVWIV